MMWDFIRLLFIQSLILKFPTSLAILADAVSKNQTSWHFKEYKALPSYHYN